MNQHQPSAISFRIPNYAFRIANCSFLLVSRPTKKSRHPRICLVMILIYRCSGFVFSTLMVVIAQLSVRPVDGNCR